MLTIEGNNIEVFNLNENGIVEVIDKDNNYVYKGYLRECVQETGNHCMNTIVKMTSYTVEKMSEGYFEKKIIEKILSKINDDDELCMYENIDDCVNYMYDGLKSYNLLKKQ